MPALDNKPSSISLELSDFKKNATNFDTLLVNAVGEIPRALVDEYLLALKKRGGIDKLNQNLAASSDEISTQLSLSVSQILERSELNLWKGSRRIREVLDRHARNILAEVKGLIKNDLGEAVNDKGFCRKIEQFLSQINTGTDGLKFLNVARVLDQAEGILKGFYSLKDEEPFFIDRSGLKKKVLISLVVAIATEDRISPGSILKHPEIDKFADIL